MAITQRQALAGNTGSSLTFTGSLAVNSLLLGFAISNSSTQPVLSTGGVNLSNAIWTAGHNGDYTGIYFLPPLSNPGSQTSMSATNSPYGLGFMEFQGASWNPLAATSSGGNATPGTSATCNQPATGAQLEVYFTAYDVSNAGSHFVDSWANVPVVCTNYAQGNYEIGAGNQGVTYTLGSSGTYDICMANFYDVANGPVQPHGASYRPQRMVMQGPG